MAKNLHITAIYKAKTGLLCSKSILISENNFDQIDSICNILGLDHAKRMDIFAADHGLEIGNLDLFSDLKFGENTINNIVVSDQIDRLLQAACGELEDIAFITEDVTIIAETV